MSAFESKPDIGQPLPANPPALMKEMFLVGNRPGHYRAFLSLLRNASSWETATKDYGRIDVPVLLIWGDQDWARAPEREHDGKQLGGVQTTTVERGGHFLALDRPQELRDLIVRFVTAGKTIQRGAQRD